MEVIARAGYAMSVGASVVEYLNRRLIGHMRGSHAVVDSTPAVKPEAANAPRVDTSVPSATGLA